MNDSAKQQPKGNREPRARRLVSAADAGTYLGVTEWAIRRWKSQGRIPFVALGRAIRYDLDDLDELIDTFKVQPGRFGLATDDDA